MLHTTKKIVILSRHTSQSYYITRQRIENYKDPVLNCIKSIQRLLRTSISSLTAIDVT